MSDETNDDRVFGESTEDRDSVEPASHSGSNWKVLGETAASDGTGVLGHSTSGSGVTTGVSGVVDSSHVDAAGVRGSAKGANVGVLAQVFDDRSSLLNLAESESSGVFGRSDKAEGLGVAGISQNHHGVGGRSDDSDSYGVFAINTVGAALGTIGDAEVSGNLDVTGNSSTGQVGVSAYLGSNVSDFSGGTIPYDSHNVDDRGEFDPSTGKVTLSVGGDFHVVGQVDYGGGWADGDAAGLDIVVNGDVKAETFRGIVASNNGPTFTVSKTLRGLGAGDEIEISAFLNSSNTPTVTGTEYLTFLTVSKIG